MEYKIPPNQRFGAKVLSFARVFETLSDIKSKLNEEQLTTFRGSCFGQFIHLKNIKWAAQIVHQLLLRQVQSDEDEQVGRMVFNLGGHKAVFSIREFNMITGLNCHAIPDMSAVSAVIEKEEDDGQPKVGLHEKYFGGRYSISCVELQKTFMKCDDPDDVIKLALVYFLETVLLGRDSKLLIDVDFLGMVEHLDSFNKYPWGTLCYKKTVEQLTNSLFGRVDKFKQSKPEFEWYNLQGFPLAFQIWAYEVLPSIAENLANCVDSTVLPRMLKWTSTKAPKSKTVIELLEGTEVQVIEMVPKEAEDNIEYTSNLDVDIRLFVKRTNKQKQFKDKGKRLKKTEPDVESVKILDDLKSTELGLRVSALIHGMVMENLSVFGNKIDDISARLNKVEQEVIELKKGHIKDNVFTGDISVSKSSQRLSAKKKDGGKTAEDPERKSTILESRKRTGKVLRKPRGKSSPTETLRRSTRLRNDKGTLLQDAEDLERKKRMARENLRQHIGKKRRTVNKKRIALKEGFDKIKGVEKEGLDDKSKRDLDKVVSDIAGGLDHGSTESTDDDPEKFFIAPHEKDRDAGYDVANVTGEVEKSVGVEVDKSLDKVDNLTVEVDNVNVDVQTTAVEVDKPVDNVNVEVDTTAVEVDNVTVHGETTDVEVDKSEYDKVDNIEVDNSASIDVEVNKVDTAAGEVDNTVFQVDKASADEVDKVDIEVDNKGVEVDNTAVEVDNTSVEVDNTAVEVDNTGVEFGESGDDKETDAEKLQLLANLATENTSVQGKRVKKRGPYQVSPYVDPTRKKRKAQQLLEFNPLSEYPKEWEIEMDEFYINPLNKDKAIDFKVCDANKEWFDTVVDQSKWLSDMHLDVAMEIIRNRMTGNPDIFTQKCAIMDTTFFSYVQIRYKLYEADTNPSHWDNDNRLLSFVDGTKRGNDSWSTLGKIYFPINVTSDHWAAGCIDMVNKKIICYDSLVKHTRQERFNSEMTPISVLIPKILIRAKFILDDSPWPVEREANVPQQDNGSDCGMFCIKFIEILSAGKDVTMLTAQDMQFIRKKFAVETWKSGMMGS